jgi:hypothetical protein
MRRALAIAALCGFALHAGAYEICVDREARKAFDREMRAFRKALPERRFADLETRYGDMLARLDRGQLSDAYVDRAFWIFEIRSLGDCAACGSRDPEPLLREWARRSEVRSRPDRAQLPHDRIGSFAEATRALAEAETLGTGRALVNAQAIRIAAMDRRKDGKGRRLRALSQGARGRSARRDGRASVSPRRASPGTAGR